MALTNVGHRPRLTHREQQVLELVAGGYSAKQIASQIGIAPRTVEGHIETVRLKMRARNKTHLITQAIQAGVLKIRAA
jgi:LuxR family transcriptional regulator of spore coat protein